MKKTIKEYVETRKEKEDKHEDECLEYSIFY